MKTLIKIPALLFIFGLFSTGAFAATKAVADTTDQDVITIAAMPYDCSVDVSVDKANTGNTMVTIYDGSDDIILREALSKESGTIEKAYDFSGLDDGNYTIEVSSNDTVTEKTVRVYSDENDQQLELSR